MSEKAKDLLSNACVWLESFIEVAVEATKLFYNFVFPFDKFKNGKKIHMVEEITN